MTVAHRHFQEYGGLVASRFRFGGATKKSESMIEILRNPQPQFPPQSAGGAQVEIRFVSLLSSTPITLRPRSRAAAPYPCKEEVG
jgi:hypothetical protein